MKSLILLLLFSVAQLVAATHYVNQAGAGTADGSSLANAWSAAAFNTGGNWSATPGTSGKISPGDTVVLNGNITTGLDVQGNGTAGNVITILFATGATMSKASWIGYAININRKEYITVDGGGGAGMAGVGGNAALANGIIESTDNGPLLTYQNSAGGVVSEASRHITVKNLVVRNMYVRQAGTDTAENGAGVFFHHDSEGFEDMHHITVTNCIFHDMHKGFWIEYVGAACTNIEFSWSTVYNCNWGGAAGNANAGAVLNGLDVHHNVFKDFTNWDMTAGDMHHHNGFFTWANNGGTATNITYRDNIIGPNFTLSPSGVNDSTSGLFIQNNITEVEVYNNVFIATAAGGNPSNGMIYLNPGYWTTGNFRIYNNTVVGEGAGIAFNISPTDATAGGAQTFTVQNNVISNTKTGISSFYNVTATIVSNKNTLHSLDAAEFCSFSVNSSSNFKTEAQWQALGYDTLSSTADPLLTATYRLGEGSPAIGAGYDLSAYFTTDLAGVTRTTWDQGAYAYYVPTPRYTRPGSGAAIGRRKQ